MIENRSCIVLARPMNINDPAMIRPDGLYVLEEILMSLREARIFDWVIISIPESVPHKIRNALASWRIELDVSPHEQPQLRLAQCMEKYGLEQTTVLTAYSVLMDAEYLDRARGIVRGNLADAVYPQSVIAPKYFIVLNSKAAKHLAESHANPLPPFVFSSKLNEVENIRLHSLTGLEDQWERFLWELLFAGERQAVPEDVLGRFMTQYVGEERFCRASFDAFIRGEYGLSDPRTLHEALESMQEYESSLRLAMHLNYARKLCDHLPEARNMALEIGHGATGLTSLALSLVFNRVLGADTYKYSSEGIQNATEFLETVHASGIEVLFPEYMVHDIGAMYERTHFHHKEVHMLPLAPNSLDFCFSHMVFEHVADVPNTSRFLARVMKEGGVMIHEIGFQDHCDLSHIHFEFLRNSPEELAEKDWRGVRDMGTNLWRINDFTSLWESLGFEVEILARDVRHVPPKRLHPYWTGYRDKDLYCYYALIKTS